MPQETSPARTMLINGQHAEQLRVAIVAGTLLQDYQIEVAESGLSRGNIYRGIITSIEPSLDAAFIDFGGARHGFLSGHDLIAQAYHRPPREAQKHPGIAQVLERGRPILVQVTKEAMGTKGAALTTNISLAGRYLVLLPYDAARGLSRKIEDDETRQRLKERAQGIPVPEGFGYILRTNAAQQTKSTLAVDARSLLRVWKQIEEDHHKGSGPRLLHNDQDLVMQALRDYLDASISEILVDNEEFFQRAQAYMRATMPRSRVKLTLYHDPTPLFTRHDVESQIESIYQRRVPLPHGGSIVIDPTEALTAIDVNSGKATQSGSQEETAVTTNLEAAREVARQLRLRDIGGLIVVDFIDMRSHRSRRTLEKTLQEAMKLDKARATVGRISENGLLEINRQRIKSSLQHRTHRPCPTCGGVGLIPSAEQVGLNLLRQIEARAAGGKLAAVKIALHPEFAHAMQNKRRTQLAHLEQTFHISVDIAADPDLHRVQQRVDWIDRPSERVIPAAEPPREVHAEGPAKEERPRTRRRRGGRRNGRRRPEGTPATAPPAEPSPDSDPPPSPDSDPPETALSPAEAPTASAEAQEPRPRRSRWRGRRRRRPPGDGPAPPPATEPAG